MAQPVKRRTLDLGPGNDLLICEFEPRVEVCADSAEPAWDPLPLLSLCASLARSRSLSLSLSQNKLKNFKKIILKKAIQWGARMAQSLKHLTLNFSSGHDLLFREFEPLIGLCTDSTEPA